jgi:hypothetical protein
MLVGKQPGTLREDTKRARIGEGGVVRCTYIKVRTKRTAKQGEKLQMHLYVTILFCAASSCMTSRSTLYTFLIVTASPQDMRMALPHPNLLLPHPSPLFRPHPRPLLPPTLNSNHIIELSCAFHLMISWIGFKALLGAVVRRPDAVSSRAERRGAELYAKP